MKTKSVSAPLKGRSRIPAELINVSFQVYNKMKQRQAKISFFQDIDWIIELVGIERYLTKLTKRGFLSQSQSRTIMRGIFDVLDKSGRARLRLASRWLKNKRGAPEDMPFNFLIFVLVRNSIRFTGKPRFRAIANLLQDREGISVGADDLRKRYRRLAQRNVLDTLLGYGTAYPDISKAADPLMDIFYTPPRRVLSPELRQWLTNNPSG